MTYYYPFGATWASSGALEVPFGFTGQVRDPETGLYYYGARYYDPSLARFISPDSIVQAFSDPQSLNRYSYCLNNPLVYTDPTGQFIWWVALIVGIVLGAASGALIAAITGQDVGMGALTGAIAGLAIAGASILAPMAAGALASVVAAEVTSAAVFAAAGASAGAINGAISGGDIGIAAAVGAGTSLLAHLMPVGKVNQLLNDGWTAAGVNADKNALAIVVNRLVKNAATGAFFGAALSGMTGGDMLQGAAMGALAWGAGEMANMAIGHGLGLAITGGASPEVKEGAFWYYSKDQQPFALGGAIIGDQRELLTAYERNDGTTYLVKSHELSHTNGIQGSLMGPLYGPLHLLSQGVSGSIGVLSGADGGFLYSTHTYNVFEQAWMEVPCH